MFDKDNPFVFVDWQDELLVTNVSDGPFQTTSIHQLHSDLPSTLSIRKHLEHDLEFPEIAAIPLCELEDIAIDDTTTTDSIVTSSSDDHNNPWSLPESLTVSYEPSLKSFDAASPSISQFPPPSSLRPHDTTLVQRSDDGALMVDSGLLLKCLRLMAQGESSLLFSITSDENFRAIEQGRFQVSRLSNSALQNLMAECKTLGEKHLSIRSYFDQILADKNVSATQVALAAALRTLLDADRDRLAQESSNLKGFVSLQAILRKTEALLAMIVRIRDGVAQSTDEQSILRSLLDILTSLRADTAFVNTVRALALSALAPVLTQLFESLGFHNGDGPDTTLLGVLLDETMGGEDTDTTSFVLAAEDRQRVKDIMQGLETLRSTRIDHPIVRGVGQSLLRDLDINTLYELDPDLILQKAFDYEKLVLDALDPDISFEEIDRITFDDHAHQLPRPETNDLYLAAFNDLASRITASPAGGQPQKSILASALREDYSAWDEARLSQSESRTILLEPMRPLLVAQSRLVSQAILEVIFYEQHLHDHLDAHRQFHLFGNGLFLRRLQTALFDSASSSPKDRLKVEGNFGLRMDARSSRWPPATSDLQLTLAGIISESYEDPSTKSTGELPGGLSFAVRSLSEEEIAAFLDPSSPRALDFLRLQYHPPPGLEIFFSPPVLDKYDSIFRFLLGLIRQSHLTKTMLHLLATRRRSAAHAFAHQAHHIISALTTYIFDLGISAPCQHLSDNLAYIEASLDSPLTASLSVLVDVHSDTLDTIRDRLFLTPQYAPLQAQVHKLFTFVLQASALLATGTQSLAADTPEIEQRIRSLNVEMKTAVTELLEQLHTAGQDGKEVEHLHLLALSLEGNGFFATHEGMDWCSL